MGKIAPVPAQPQGLAKDMWVGEPPPKPAAPSWWGMYADFKGCDGCCFGCFCMPCAHGEVMEWATDEPGSACRHCITNVCCTYVFPCFAPLYIPWAIADARSKSEEKIWKFHNARSDPKALYMGSNFETHQKECIIAFLPLGWCCGFGIPLAALIVALGSGANYAVMKRFKAAHAKDANTTATA